MQSFEEYLSAVPGYNNNEKTNTNYLGISKKESPKWGGWSIINKYRQSGILARDIEDSNLLILVENYYYLLYLEECVFRND